MANELELGMAIGELTEAVKALTKRIGDLEVDTKRIQGVLSNGKWFVFGGAVMLMLALKGLAGVLQNLRDWTP